MIDNKTQFGKHKAADQFIEQQRYAREFAEIGKDYVELTKDMRNPDEITEALDCAIDCYRRAYDATGDIGLKSKIGEIKVWRGSLNPNENYRELGGYAEGINTVVEVDVLDSRIEAR